MKKKIIWVISFILLICLILLIWLLKSKYTITDNLVNLSIKEKNIDESKITLILENYTDNTYIYGDDYFIEKNILGTWYTIMPKKDTAFNLIGYSLYAGESKEINIDLTHVYRKLSRGKYRIIKTIFLEKEKPTEPSVDNLNEQEDIYICTEFIIK